MKNHAQIKTMAAALLGVLLLLLPAAAQEKGRDTGKGRNRTKRTPDPLMRLIPKDSLFCVRVNNLEQTLTSLDEFAAGALPLPFKLAGFLKGQNWNNVVRDGSFAVFGVVLPGQPQQDNPLADVFVGALIPVTDYGKLLRESEKISRPDENGISRTDGGPLVTRAGKYALLSWKDDYEKLLRAKKVVTARSAGLRSALGPAGAVPAARQPIWAYVNIHLVKQTFGPFIAGKIAQLKERLKAMEPARKGTAIEPGPVIDMYAAILEVLGNEIQHVTVTLEPTAEALGITKTVVAREGTELARSFAASPKRAGRNTFLGYLEDGAIMNVSARANAPFFARTYIRSLDLFSFLGGVSGEDIEKLKSVMAESFEAMGDDVVFSFKSRSDQPFILRYVVGLADPEKFARSLAAEIELMNSGIFDDIYKNFGMKMEAKVERGATTYKGVSIDAARVVITGTEPDSEQGRLIEAMYGDGFDYRWAIVDDVVVYVVGGEVDKAVRELIDQVKSKARRRIAGEIRTARQLLAVKGTGDFFGTFNYVRLLKMISTMTQGLPGGQAMPAIDTASSSNLAFRGSFRNGRMTVKSVLPKAHLREVITAFITLQKAAAERRAALRSGTGRGDAKRQYQPLFNGKDLTGWEPSGGAKWEVIDGMLVGTQGQNNAPGDLFTKESFRDFELICTYRTEWPCNSGIWFRYQSPSRAYQADILEWKDPVCYSGTLYCPGKMFIAMNQDKSLVNRDGLNTMKVRAEGDHLQIWINGHKVADVHDDTTDSGKIGFQVHPGQQFGPMKIIVKEILVKRL